mmetsp:Transcript_8249/g.10161  ORF Transcript_8249/g.10161 Transcript_8249/m.10161 type:complete len:241 (-) Transcript_8249:59-781(-)
MGVERICVIEGRIGVVGRRGLRDAAAFAMARILSTSPSFSTLTTCTSYKSSNSPTPFSTTLSPKPKTQASNSSSTSLTTSLSSKPPPPSTAKTNKVFSFPSRNNLVPNTELNVRPCRVFIKSAASSEVIPANTTLPETPAAADADFPCEIIFVAELFSVAPVVVRTRVSSESSTVSPSPSSGEGKNVVVDGFVRIVSIPLDGVGVDGADRLIMPLLSIRIFEEVVRLGRRRSGRRWWWRK